MPLEYVGTVERLLSRGTGARTEPTYHGTFVVRQGVSVLVVLPGEPFVVVFASSDGALLWSLGLVGKHVRLQILEDTPTFGEGAEALFASLVIELVAASALAAGARMLRVKGSIGSPSLAAVDWIWLEALGVEVGRG
jgi:hypothetical protein